ncbi:MAG: pilus assembly protein [Chloroflexi bacterium]|nr:MAG: pilus assembly protein [Chloroflexota bacterium]
MRHQRGLQRFDHHPLPIRGRRLRLLRLQRPEHPRRRDHDPGVEPSHDGLVRYRARGQALLEFALIAPVLLLMIGATVDLGRGLLIYTMLQGASRDMARQAVLGYYSGSNTLPPTCTALATPCTLGPLTNGAHQLDALGMSVVYQDSSAISSPPSYGTYAANANPLLPGTITLTGAINASTVYAFVYELDARGGNPNPRWSCPTCSGANGAAVRTSGHQLVVVDLKLQWKPVLNTLLGIPSVITFDSQSVERLEY